MHIASACLVLKALGMRINACRRTGERDPILLKVQLCDLRPIRQCGRQRPRARVPELVVVQVELLQRRGTVRADPVRHRHRGAVAEAVVVEREHAHVVLDVRQNREGLGARPVDAQSDGGGPAVGVVGDLSDTDTWMFNKLTRRSL